MGQLTVYVSSTFIELVSHCAALETALEGVGFDGDCM